MTPTLLEKKSVEITRTGAFFDERYGRFEITADLLLKIVENFNRRVLGVDIFVDVSHRPEEGAAGKITRLWIENDRLLGEVEWTPYGRQAIQDRGYQYLSAEYTENHIDNESGIHYGAVLRGAGLTIRPVIRHLKPVELSEVDALEHDLAQCSPNVRNALVGSFLSAAAGLPEAADRIALAECFREIGEGLPAPTPEPARPLSPAIINQVIAAADRRERARAHRGAERLAERRAAYRKSLTDHPSWATRLNREQQALLLGSIALVQPSSSDGEVVALAEHQSRLIDAIAIGKQLADLGWQGATPAPPLW